MISHFYQKVKINGRLTRVLDFQKIRDEKFPINLIISERGLQGKSFNAKEHIIDRWRKYKEKGLWILNSQSQIDNEWRKFLTNNRKFYPEKWENIEITKDGLFDKKEGEMMCYFVSLFASEKYKGGRDSAVTTIIYDEFNVGLSHIRTMQTKSLFSLIHTFTDPHGDKKGVSLFIFGNQKTLATPLLADLKIFKITKELETHKDLIMIYSPVKDMIKLNEKNKGNWLYEAETIAETADANFGNIATEDDFTGVNKDLDLSDYRVIGFLKVQQRFFKVYQGKGMIYFQWTRTPDLNNCIYFLREDAEVNMLRSDFFREEVSLRIQHFKCNFDSIISKILIKEAVS